MKHLFLVAIVTLAACSSERHANEVLSGATNTDAQSNSGFAAPSADVSAEPKSRSALMVRLDAIDAAIGDWRRARTLAEAKAGAEKARNLITGPGGPDYGDFDGDGEIAGQVDVGLLPGLAGQSGLATDHPNPCMQNDVLGGDFSNAAARWATMDRAINDWRAGNNTFPSLPSHPQRIVGWATLTLTRANLAQAQEYAGHAQLHAGKTRAAVAGCEV
ncbi:MAG: hypothetical protein ABIW33_00960 [Sphingomicrobium sp.]